MDIKLSNIEILLKQLKAAKHIHIQDLDWIDPVGIAILKQYKVSYSEVEVKTSARSFSYVKKLLDTAYDPMEHHLSVIHFDDKTDNIDELKSILTHKIIDYAENLSSEEKEDLSEYLEYMISEMMGNVTSHAKSFYGGFVTAQYYPRERKVQVVIIDGGIGFLATLSRLGVIKEEEAIQKALEKDVTGSNKYSTYNNVPEHAGLGLFFLSRIIEETNGNLVIISNNTIFRFPDYSINTFDTSFKGSVIAFEMYVNNIDNDFMTLFKRIGYREVVEDNEDIF